MQNNTNDSKIKGEVLLASKNNSDAIDNESTQGNNK